MHADEFRKLALSLPQAVESSHMNHPDYRVGGKVFASLCVDGSWAMVKLEPQQQAEYVADDPDVYQAANGAWGKAGATMIQLENAAVESVGEALMRAWRKTAPKKLINELDN